MRFKRKIITWYLVLITALISCFGIFLYNYNIYQLREKSCQDLAFLAENLSRQMDELITPMEFVVSHLLSDQVIVDATTTLTYARRDSNVSNANVLIAKQSIRMALHSDYLIRKFSRVSYFNSTGDFVTNNFMVSSIKDGDLEKKHIGWLPDRNILVSQKPVLIPPRPDPWATNNPPEVFSLIKAIQGSEKRGYIEIQRPSSELYSLFNFNDYTTINAVVINSSGVVIYSPFDSDNTAFYTSQILSDNDNYYIAQNPITKEKELIVRAYSDYSDIYIGLIQSESVWMAPISLINLQMLLILAVVMLLSIVYTILFANKLTKPIRELKLQIQSTGLENLDNAVEFYSSNDEVQGLKDAYTDLMERLKRSIIKENESISLQIQAQLDALQAQINPHFLYNVLNVLSYRGILNDDEVICDICDNLAAMLRYATNTTQRFSTVEEELGYLKNYIFLLETRYQEQFAYTIDVDKRILSQLLPKVVLQQFVENAVNHAYSKVKRRIEISITGYIKNDYWFIEIKDNGQGFDTGILDEINEKIDSIKAEFLLDKIVHNMEIGGMGIFNTYTRLLLCYKKDLVFKISSMIDKGSCILMGSKIK